MSLKTKSIIRRFCQSTGCKITERSMTEKPRNVFMGTSKKLKPVDENHLHINHAGSMAEIAESTSNVNDKKVIRRSSMICSEGFDKYTFDCHRNDIPHRSIGLELDTDNGTHIHNSTSFAHQKVPKVPLLSTAKLTQAHYLVKRNSVVHPGNLDVPRSQCINGKFQNVWPTWQPPTISNILKFGLTKDKSNVPSKQELDIILPIVKPKFSQHFMTEDGMRITWIGHSTVLIQMHGLNILTDPIFSERASPSQVVGPKRYRDIPCSIHDLPHIDAVVISHTHYDHLDYNTVRLLNARFDTNIRWFVPLGLLPWMHEVGCENVVQLDWWEENCVPEHSDTFFIFTPAQHWSKRTVMDDNKVLWGSWCIIGPKYKFFFAGDTGYCEVFKQIGQIYGPFDMAAIPIGAYEPRWFMKYQHVNPEDAVKIYMDTCSKYSLAIHWGTFCLGNEYYLDPPMKLRQSLDQHNIPPSCFFTLKHGDSRTIKKDSPSSESVQCVK